MTDEPGGERAASATSAPPSAPGGMNPKVVAAFVAGAVAAVVVTLLVVLVLVPALGSDDDGTTSEQATEPSTEPSVIDTVPGSQGGSCADQVGDISTLAATQGAASDPPAADLVRAAAAVEGTDLAVEMQTNGQIDTLTDPLFIVAQGEAGRSISFELRADRNAQGAWQLTLVSFPANEPRERRTVLAAPVTVTGDTISFRVPLADLPLNQVSTFLQFGVSAELEGTGTVIDECSTLDEPAGSSTTASTTSSPTAPPTTG